MTLHALFGDSGRASALSEEALYQHLACCPSWSSSLSTLGNQKVHTELYGKALIVEFCFDEVQALCAFLVLSGAPI